MASSSSSPKQKYEVFLSFRGEDTRNSFVSHLYTALHQRGIITFIDKLNIEKGQFISTELTTAIEESKFAIIVFSKNYASSVWCLLELEKIMECRSNYGQTIIPIFYDVQPSDVGKQKKTFAESFAEHEVNLKDNMETTVQIWRENLRKVAKIAGHDLSKRNVCEASCINEIVENIFRKLPRKFSTKGLVGIEDHMKKLKSLLTKEPNSVCFLGIWGMGGIGKTTIARALYDELIGGFGGGCFLHDVCKRDIVGLQKILISEALKLEHVYISNEYEGSIMIRNRLCCKRVMLVLDNVNDAKQLNLLARDGEWFGAGSKIIVTTRDKHLLHKVNGLYKIDTLPNSEAIHLFCFHAFKMSHPPENFVKLSKSVVSYACGLPLALEVLGSYLSGREKNVWKSTLDRLKDDPEENIIVALKISFDSLSDTQRNIFLDIACFFKGHHKDEDEMRWPLEHNDKVVKKLDSFGLYPLDGITVLIEKALIHISDEKVQMHDLIQEMGWNIVRQKANKEPGRYSRLWDSKDIIDVLTNDKGTGEIEGLVLQNVGYFNLKEEAFKNMNKLRLLDVCAVGRYLQAPNYLPNSLRWLHWDYYLAKSLPENFKPRNLVCLNLPFSEILQTPDVSCMPNLEVLNLYRCLDLLEVHPSVGVHKKLVHLNLTCCSKLKKFPILIQMESLEILEMDYCTQLQTYPEFHSNVRRLKTLTLQKMNIKKLPWSLGGLTSLREIDMSQCHNLRALPIHLCGLIYLESVYLSGCSKLEYFFKNPNDEAVHSFDSYSSYMERKRAEYNGSFWKMLPAFLSLPYLRNLDMSDCGVSELILPERIGCLHSLQKLNLSRNKFVSLPVAINLFSSLQFLCLADCKMLEALPELPSSITELVLDNCTALTWIPHLVDLLRTYKGLNNLSLGNCKQLSIIKDTYDNPIIIALRQNIPHFLSAFWDWGYMSYILCTKQKVVRVCLPGIEVPDWLYQSGRAPLVTITLSPSWYNDKLRGFVVCSISTSTVLKVVTCNGFVIRMPISTFPVLGLVHASFVYIPIHQITSVSDWNGRNDSCLFEVTGSYRNKVKWGIRLVYEGEVDITALTIANHNGPTDIYSTDAILKVCVGPRSHI